MDSPACPAIGPAMDYISEVQNRFADDPAVYQQFIKLLTDSQKDPGTKSTAKAEQSIKILFSNHPDLIEGFQQFLPAEGTRKEEEVTPQSPSSDRQRQLLKVFTEYNENPTTLGELSGTLKELFGDDPALLKLLDQYTPAVDEGQK
ncbi:hypothetical protein BKA65DRAFT_508616 [Rhexocercosporidium sp. MPI-PUGE-AT-0058]|nr:hypothetical protein BKA65DRAFT_508616 [Rhexocercosporidium sp. MPI-PUGE-AT-0058]